MKVIIEIKRVENGYVIDIDEQLYMGCQSEKKSFIAGCIGTADDKAKNEICRSLNKWSEKEEKRKKENNND